MKRFFIFFVIVTMTISAVAQSPGKMGYQCVIRNASGALITNHAVGMKISILQGSATGTVIYVETHTTTTNANGLATIEIGGGTPVTGTFAGINWTAGPYWLKTETDPAGGTSYTIFGTNPLLSVPYALNSKNTESIADNIVTSAKIADGSVATTDLAANSVTTDKINTGAVTGTKIAQAGATSGQALKWNGTTWAPGNDLAGGSLWTQSGSKIYYNTGNVGVGITDPLEQLHVKGSVLLSTNEKKLLFFTQGTGEDIMSTNTLHINHSNNQTVSIGEGGTSNLLVSGKVGIGTTNPGALLNISGNSTTQTPHLLLSESEGDYARLSFKNTAATTKNWSIAGRPDPIDANSRFNVWYWNGTTGNDILSITGKGDIGIGTTAPTAVLNIFGNSTESYPQLLLTENQDDYSILMFKSTAFQTKNWTIAAKPHASEDFAFLNFYYNNGTIGNDIMTIVGNRRVGIGTKTPNYTLDVRGTIGNNTTLYHSDLRWKIDIQPIKYGVSDLLKLNSVSYLWNTDGYPEMGFDKETQFGFIAQEFEKVIPELVKTDADGYKSIDYVKLTPVLVKAMKEQQLQIESLKREIDALKTIVNSLTGK